MDKVQSDVVIVGGGIAGLWLYNTLKAKGVQVLLLEKYALGSGQSIASQGMVHGGQRYALQGQNTPHSVGIAEMPALWEKALAGQGDVDLAAAKLLSRIQVLWSPGSLASNMALFLASKAMRARVKKMKADHYPEALRSKKFNGHVYQMDECVLDMASTLNVLASHYPEGIFKAEIVAYNTKKDVYGFESIRVSSAGAEVEIIGNHFIFTAATGNEEALEALGIPAESESQRRPLHQIMLKGGLPSMNGHCLAPDYEPRVTITTHQTKEGENVWYLGGRVSTRTTGLSKEENIQHAKTELEDIFPWMDLSGKEWSTLFIDRAESKYQKGLPDGPVVKEYGNALLCWPTKLTFAPGLTAVLLKRYGGGFQRGGSVALPFEKPPVATYPWDETTWIKF